MNIFKSILICIILISCSKQKELKLKERNNKENLFFKLNKKTIKLSKLGRNDSAIFYAKKMLFLAKKNKDTFNEGKAFYKIGLYFNRKKYIDSAYYYYLQSLNLFKDLNDSLMIGKRYLNIAKIESNKGLYLISNSSGVKALKYLEPKKSVLLSQVYNCLGINKNEQKRYKESIDWYIKAIEITKDSLQKLRYFNNIANNYRELNNYKLSLNYYNKIIKSSYYDSLTVILKSKVLDNYAFTKFKGKEIIKVNDFLNAQKLKNSINDSLGLIANYSHLSDYYSLIDKKKAFKYANLMYNFSKKIKRPKDRLEALSKMILLEEKKYKIKKNFIESNYLYDSIQNENNRSKNQFATTVYKYQFNFQEERKEKLKFKASLAKTNFNLEKQKSQKQFWIFIGIALLLSLITYIFYKTQKTKKEKIIEVYKTETRLAKKIHDELANDVYLAMNKLQNETNSSTILLHDLEKIYDQTRNISHENSPVVTGEKFQGFLEQLFIDFSTDTCKVLYKGLSETGIDVVLKEKQIVLYRVLQELLINMKKYSKANLVIVSFSVLKNNLEVAYKDNGIGTDVVIIKNGLQNMETRIKSVGGTITFESEKEKGFKVNFQFKK